MKTLRLQLFTNDVLSSEARPHVSTLPCMFRTYDLKADNGTACTVSVFPRNNPPVAFVPPDAPSWAEEAVNALL